MQNNIVKINSYVYSLQYCELKPVIILNNTIEIPRKKPSSFSKKTCKQNIHVHTHSLTPCCSSALHWGFPISICGFRNITDFVQMYSLTTSEWMLRFLVSLFELLGLWFWFVGVFFWGIELFVLVRVDFWIWASMFSWQSCKNDSHYPFKKSMDILFIFSWHLGN